MWVCLVWRMGTVREEVWSCTIQPHGATENLKHGQSDSRLLFNVATRNFIWYIWFSSVSIAQPWPRVVDVLSRFSRVQLFATGWTVAY